MPINFNFLPVKTTINCNGKIIDLQNGRVMGILNATPDSFFDGGKFKGLDAGLARASQMILDGADFIDVGGYSSRPGADEVSRSEEMDRILPLIEKIMREFPEAVISVDTFRADVAENAIRAGASIINDVTAGEGDQDMFSVVARSNVPYIIMHKKGNFKEMQKDPDYSDVVKEVIQYLNLKIEKLEGLGIHDIIIDPGFGFGKTTEHNFTLLKHLDMIRISGKPVLAGISRKSMINKVLKTKPETALTGTISANILALAGGAAILRVHDVKEAVETIKMLNFYRETV